MLGQRIIFLISSFFRISSRAFIFFYNSPQSLEAIHPLRHPSKHATNIWQRPHQLYLKIEFRSSTPIQSQEPLHASVAGERIVGLSP
jgi:hypothetical protein